MSERDDLAETRRDLDALLDTLPPEVRRSLDTMNRFSLETHRMLLRMLTLRRWLFWLTGANIVMLALQVAISWGRA